MLEDENMALLVTIAVSLGIFIGGAASAEASTQGCAPSETTHNGPCRG